MSAPHRHRHRHRPPTARHPAGRVAPRRAGVAVALALALLVGAAGACSSGTPAPAAAPVNAPLGSFSAEQQAAIYGAVLDTLASEQQQEHHDGPAALYRRAAVQLDPRGGLDPNAPALDPAVVDRLTRDHPTVRITDALDPGVAVVGPVRGNAQSVIVAAGLSGVGGAVYTLDRQGDRWVVTGRSGNPWSYGGAATVPPGTAGAPGSAVPAR